MKVRKQNGAHKNIFTITLSKQETADYSQVAEFLKRICWKYHHIDGGLLFLIRSVIDDQQILSFLDKIDSTPPELLLGLVRMQQNKYFRLTEETAGKFILGLTKWLTTDSDSNNVYNVYNLHDKADYRVEYQDNKLTINPGPLRNYFTNSRKLYNLPNYINKNLSINAI